MKSIKSICSINLNQKYSKSEIKYLVVLVHKDEQHQRHSIQRHSEKHCKKNLEKEVMTLSDLNQN